MRTLFLPLALSLIAASVLGDHSTASALAWGQGVSIPGASCWTGHYHRGAAQYDSMGVRNDSTWDSMNVWCPAKLGGESSSGQSRDITWATATIYDRTPTSSVHCKVYARTRSEARYLSSNRNTNTTFLGFTTFEWSSAPLNGGYPIGNMETLGVTCWIPQRDGDVGRSGVVGAAIGYQNELVIGSSLRL